MKKCFLFALYVMGFLSIHDTTEATTKKLSIVPTMKKGDSVESYFRAVGEDSIILPGGIISTIGDARHLPFDHHEEKHGDDIHRISRSEFELNPGHYLVSFTGTFMASPTGVVTREIGLKIGDKIVFFLKDSNPSLLDNLGCDSFTQDIRLWEKGRLSIIARTNNMMPMQTTALHRTISIIKLKD